MVSGWGSPVQEGCQGTGESLQKGRSDGQGAGAHGAERATEQNGFV